jgi:hypothetical protein
MTNLTPDETKEYIMKKEQYSGNVQKSVYQQEQTNDIYAVNYVLWFVYYAFLIYYTYFAYNAFRYSNQYYKKLTMIILLFAYPFIIYPIQYGVYTIVMYLVRMIYTNTYNNNGW